MPQNQRIFTHSPTSISTLRQAAMDNGDNSDDGSDPGIQVRVALTLAPSVLDQTLEIPGHGEPLAVPADIGRKGLSALLNHLLGRRTAEENADSDDDDDDSDSDDDKDDDMNKLPALTFEFTVGKTNRLLRKGVEKEARQHGLSLEEAIVITYFPAANAPEMSGQDEELPDWVSCLSSLVGRGREAGSNDDQDEDLSSLVVTGCYDGSLHLFQQQQERDDKNVGMLTKVAVASAATGPIKAVATTTIVGENDCPQFFVAAASLDHTLTVHSHQYDGDKENGSLRRYGQCVASADGHSLSSPVDSLDFAPYSTKPSLLVGGDGNGTISVWNIAEDADNIDADGSAKKQKTLTGTKESSSRTIVPILTMEGAHSQRISGLSWGNNRRTKGGNNHPSHLISGSWDHSIKLFDVEKQNCLLTLNGARVVACLDTSYHSEGVLATGHPDCTVRLWDVRANSNDGSLGLGSDKPSSVKVSDTTFRPSHKAWVSSVRWSPSNAYHLASSSHDGTVKLWDIRSSTPLYTVRAFPKEEKSLCLLWGPSLKSNDRSVLYAGGSDKIVKQIVL